MTILITGAFGQLGQVLVRKIGKSKEDVILIDKNENSNFSKNKKIITDITKNENLKKYKNELKDVTKLIHLASYITNDRDVLKSGPESIDLNIMGTINLLRHLPKIKQIIFTSSYMVYGTPKKRIIDENHPTNPNVVYGASKLATEKYLQIFCKELGVKLSILRMMGIYGVEKSHGQAIPTFIKLISENQNPIIIGSGKEKRNHLYIDDAIDSILKSIKLEKTGIFNIGGKDMLSNLEIIENINGIMNKKILPKFKKSTNPYYDFITDISKAKNELGFEPMMSIDNGIKNTIKKYNKNN
jgi:UDP-glucose 4-epimerase